MNKRRRLIFVGLFYALMSLYAGVSAYQTFAVARSYPGWQAVMQGDAVRINYVMPNGPASDLRYGDEIAAINGQPINSISQLPRTVLRAAPGSPYSIVVRRDGQLREFNFQTIETPLSLSLLLVALSVLLPAFILVTGLTVFLLKPEDKQALLLALMFAAFIPPTNFSFIEGLPRFLAAVMVIGPMITPLAFPMLFHFFLVFPEPSLLLRRFPRLEQYLYLPWLLIILPVMVLLSLSGVGLVRTSAFPGYALANLVKMFLIPLYMAGGVLSLIITYRQANQLSRRRLRVVVAGIICGMLPAILVFFVIAPWFDLSRISPTLGEWLPTVVSLLLPLVPLSFAYAIIRHKVIPVSLMLRRSLQYLLAKNALRIILALPVIGIVLTILANPQRTLSEILFRNSIYFYLLLLAAAAVSLRYRKRLTEWVDRKFFREHYDQEKILRDLIDDVRKSDSMKEMAKLISNRVDSALHPEHIYLFYREEEKRTLSLGYSSGGESRELHIPEEFELLRYMEYQGGALDFPFPQKNNLPQSEKEWLARLGTRLIVPMSGTDNRLAGLFLLGEKKAEVPYTATDRELLETLADQIAIVYENVRLKEHVHRDRKIKQEVLARFEDRKINLLKECPACGACFDSSAQLCPKDHSELTLSLPVERNIDARYRLDQLIGKGGMGAVYEAYDQRLSRKVAVKILTGSMFGNSEALRRFEREAQAAARLSHPQIITVYDYGVLNTEGAYLVMELARGETLGRRIKRDRHLHPQIAAECFDQVLEAIKAAHRAAIIHRDLKPENVLILQGEKNQMLVKILDFGLAKIVAPVISDKDTPTEMVTTPGTVMGTFGYMSPEQLTGGQVDERSDLFSIGVMVVEALTGRRPFSGRTYHELLANILEQQFHLPDQSPQAQRLDAVLQKCLAKEPSERIASAADLQHELIPAMRQCPALAHHQAVNLDGDTILLK
jgi:hypothetical protein